MALKNRLKHINGKDCGEIIVYALSTCQWCNKTKALLKELRIDHDYIDVDELDKAEDKELNGLFKHMGLEMNFPVIVINDSKVIVGYQEDKIRKLSK